MNESTMTNITEFDFFPQYLIKKIKIAIHKKKNNIKMNIWIFISQKTVLYRQHVQGQIEK